VFIVFGVQHGIDIPPAKHIYRLSVEVAQENFVISDVAIKEVKQKI
jgi:hypothetical protein